MPSATTRFLSNWSTNGSSQFDLLTTGNTPVAGDSNFPLSNLGVTDRYVSAYCGTTTDSFLYVDLLSNRTVSSIGILNLDTGANLSPYTFQFDYAPTTANFTVASCSSSAGIATLTTTGNFVTAGVVTGMVVSGAGVAPYNCVVTAVTTTSLTLSKPANGGSGTASFFSYGGGTTSLVRTSTAPGGGKDGFVELTSSVLARRWRVWTIGAFNAFTLGNVLLGTVAADTGVGFSKGTQGRYVRTRITAPTVNGVIVRSEPGRPHYEYTLEFRSVPQATRDILLAQAKAAPFILLDAYGSMIQADMNGDALAWQVQWGTPDLYDVTFPVIQLP